MRLLDLTLATPAENIALDEALLEEAEALGTPGEVLRLWEPTQAIVVVGRGSQIHQEVDQPACQQRGVPILRRASGGAAIVTAPGCLMYAVVLSYALRPALRSLDEAHRLVLETTLRALRPHVADVARQGTSDLTLGPRKFSGNSVRCKREHVLYHGTLLYNFPLPLVAECLTMPPRQPDYRHNRWHDDFVANLPLSADQLRAALIEAWQAAPDETDWPRERVRHLVETRYSQDAWNLQR